MLPFPNKKYQIIYADPPWSYTTWSDKGTGRSAKKHYEVMRLVDILDLPVKEIIDDNCILFLWCIFPMLPEALKTIKEWGFHYKAIGFVWIKKNKKSDSYFWGMGYWTRANAEICLIATKGKPKRISASVHSIIDTPIEEHSRKPKIVKEKIIELCGDLPRIELFARPPKDLLFEDESYKGWDLWGNEV